MIINHVTAQVYEGNQCCVENILLQSLLKRIYLALRRRGQQRTNNHKSSRYDTAAGLPFNMEFMNRFYWFPQFSLKSHKSDLIRAVTFCTGSTSRILGSGGIEGRFI